jgi:hypothetical protein
MLIGTHNSGSYQFDFNISFWEKNNKWELLRKSAKILPCMRKKIIELSKCQKLNILEQLKLGVNLLDLRISQSNDIFYISHTFCCVKLLEVLEHIKIYLDEMYSNSDIQVKPIIILISPDAQNHNTLIGKESNLLDFIKTQLNQYLNNEKLIIYYKPIQLNMENYKEFYNMDKLNNIWYNVQSTTNFIKKFNETKFSKYDGLCCVLTPSEDKWYTLLSTTIEKYARDINPISLFLLENNILQKKSIPIYCTFDYIDEQLIEKYKNIITTLIY